jgi:hypothetical protein
MPIIILLIFIRLNFVFKKIVNVYDYLPFTTGGTEYTTSGFQSYYESRYDGSPYPATNYYPWYSPMVILALDEDDNFWTFDSYWNNLINWTDWDGTELPDVDSETAVLTFIMSKWAPYVS